MKVPDTESFRLKSWMYSNHGQSNPTKDTFPFVCSSKSIENQINKKNSNKKNDDGKRKQRKSKPWKCDNNKIRSFHNNSDYSDYNLVKLREKYKYHQMDYIEGRKRFCKLFITQFKPSKHSKKYLCIRNQNVYEFAQKSIESKNCDEELEPLIKLPDWEEESKGGNELLSGKKESTTASRSPNSETEK